MFTCVFSLPLCFFAAAFNLWKWIQFVPPCSMSIDNENYKWLNTFGRCSFFGIAPKEMHFYLLFPRPFHPNSMWMIFYRWPQRKDLLFRVHCSRHGLSVTNNLRLIDMDGKRVRQNQKQKKKMNFLVSILSPVFFCVHQFSFIWIHLPQCIRSEWVWWNLVKLRVTLVAVGKWGVILNSNYKKKVSCIIYVSIYFQQKQISWIICAQRLFTSLPPAQQTKSIHIWKQQNNCEVIFLPTDYHFDVDEDFFVFFFSVSPFLLMLVLSCQMIETKRRKEKIKN